MGPREVVLATVVPAVASVGVLLALHAVLARGERGRLEQTRAGNAGARSGGPWALGVAFVVLVGLGVTLGSYAWQSRVDLWAASVTHRVPAMGGVAVAVGLLGVLTPLLRTALGGGLLAAVGGGAVGWMALVAMHESLISETARWGWIGGVGLIAGVQAWAMGAGARALPGWRGPASVWLVVGVCALGATAGLANAPLVLWPVSAAAFGLAVVGLFRRDTDLLAGAVPVVVVVLMGVLTLSNWFGDRERWLMLGLLSAAPMAIGLAALLASKPVWVRLVVAGGVALGIAGAQAAIAVPALLEASGGDSYEYDY